LIGIKYGLSHFYSRKEFKMAKPKQSISERLSFANVAITNALSDAQIGKLLVEYGYNYAGVGRRLKALRQESTKAVQTKKANREKTDTEKK
jgi:hypothetical protein